MGISRLYALVLGLLGVLSIAAAAAAHEVRPAVADAEIGPGKVLVQYRIVLEPILAGIDLTGLGDTNDSPLSGLNDQLRSLPAAELETRFRAAWPQLSRDFRIESGGESLPPEIVSLSVPEGGDGALPRDSTLILSAALPPGSAPVQIGWASRFGPLVLRQDGEGDDLYSAYLTGGQMSDPLPREGVASESALSVFGRFVVLGVEHIVPKGLDHILFVLGLFFFSLRMKPLLLQISAFTAAHTVTLALASLGIVTVPAAIVEPLIAASITFVALENIRGGRIGWFRIAVVFCFGLLHGLGFASVLGELQLPNAQFVTGLIAFNIGVEIGQLTVITLAWALIARPFGDRPWYRSRIAVPASALIAAVGAWWVVERTLL
ncbi:HupE/UreJ family protein [Mangrovicoccus sp. HB161399]|uniref:HupE/UreJ family protein n=1 Tax=Mangrovicoccus sp. HB161399 TaxID=2720392 RepID=UPI0020A6A05C|nr:HupE/UreJ family protein [Mangrovicoccus sp. HB161399]